MARGHPRPHCRAASPGVRSMSAPVYEPGGPISNHEKNRRLNEARLAKVAAANRLRRPCPHCGLAISPQGMVRHVALCADE